MSEKKVTTTVYLTERQKWQLDILSRNTRVPVAEYVRQGIDKVLQRELPQYGAQLELPLRYR